MTRKEQLRARAFRYYRRARGGEAISWEDGYKAAMKDLRKLVRACREDTAHHTEPAKRIAARNHCVRVQLERWLRPLR